VAQRPLGAVSWAAQRSVERMGKAAKARSGTPYALAGKRVWVAGHRGMVGAALVRRLAGEDRQVLTVDRRAVDLTRQDAVERWMAETRPQAVFVAAAKVGGILANDSFPAEFLYENLQIEANIIHAAWKTGVEKLLFLGSSCIYPKHAPQPIPEEALLTGPLEPTNEWYAIAKIAGIKLCEAYRQQYGCDFISAMPTNLYGPGDNYDLASSHVLPALIRKAHEAKVRKDSELVIWGTGSPRREFLHVDDCADALVHLMQVYSAPGHINVGSGEDLTILELARHVCAAVGFAGAIAHDLSKPDGTPRKLISGEKLRALGWRPRISLQQGIADAYRAVLADCANLPAVSGWR
jgi:GDP-L-fucose synthase